MDKENKKLNDFIFKVKEFHEVFGHPVRKEIGFPDAKTSELRIKLLQEELNELKEAIDNKDLVEVADAFADIQYVLAGAILCFGLHGKFNDIYQEVQNSNMSKLGPDGKPIYREDGKIMKGENFFQPNIEGILLGMHSPNYYEREDYAMANVRNVITRPEVKDAILNGERFFILLEKGHIFTEDMGIGEDEKDHDITNLVNYAKTCGYKYYINYGNDCTDIVFIKQ